MFRLKPVTDAVIAAAIFAGVFALTTASVRAAGPYDGVWTIDIPQAGRLAEGGFACQANRIQFLVTNNVVSGNLQQGGAGNVQTGSSGPTAAAVTGSVSSNGTLDASWQGFKATGQLTGGNGQVTVQTRCGDVQAAATRTAG